MRFLSEEPKEAELRAAIDMFVLTGAVKLYRQRHGAASYRHHTMLVHEAMVREAHREAAATIAILWRTGAYHTPDGLARLRALYTDDVLPVARARAGDLPTPDDFDDLRQDIAEAIRRITPADSNLSPVIVVNSDADLERQQESLDFDQRQVWRILVGGNKLARGFTVEGLTVTYYRRAAENVDTLMQMGRWFGFRPGYRDLVRLYTTPDLHSRFEAAFLDEEFLRRELRQYAIPTAGDRLLTPREVPPLIAQHRPDLRPAARNKMWNARLVEKSSPGSPMEPVAYPPEGDIVRRNNSLWEPVLAAATRTVMFKAPGAPTTYEARIAVLSHRDMLTVLTSLSWPAPDTFQPELNWLRALRPDQLDRWVVVIPYQVRNDTRRTLLGHGPFSIFQRRRTDTGSFLVFSEGRHRNAAYRIAGIPTENEDPEADALSAPATAAMIVYPTVLPDTLGGTEGDPVDPAQVTLGFHAITPVSSTPAGGKLIKWVTVDRGNPRAVVVDACQRP